jgi:hypothetical protein
MRCGEALKHRRGASCWRVFPQLLAATKTTNACLVVSRPTHKTQPVYLHSACPAPTQVHIRGFAHTPGFELPGCCDRRRLASDIIVLIYIKLVPPALLTAIGAKSPAALQFAIFRHLHITATRPATAIWITRCCTWVLTGFAPGRRLLEWASGSALVRRQCRFGLVWKLWKNFILWVICRAGHGRFVVGEGEV